MPLDFSNVYETFSLPDQPQMFARAVLASKAGNSGIIGRTLHLRYPRIIHAELMTHRVFSRNARSSRAVPAKRMLQEIADIPFVPWHWTGNQPGMQGIAGFNAPVLMQGSAAQFVDSDKAVSNEAGWLHARDMMLDSARSFAEAGYHKQIVNRLVEPFMWIDVLVTSTDWANFIWLRNHEAAEPHIRDLARLVSFALEDADSKAQVLPPGYWHTPYIKPEEYRDAPGNNFEDQVEFLCKISAARSARISYKPFDGDASYERELQRAEDLRPTDDPVHASPFEHQFTPDTFTTKREIGSSKVETIWANRELHGNLRGMIQYRKTIPNEAKHG